MKKNILLIWAFALMLVLTQCQSNSNAKKLVGIWQLQYMIVNGTALPGKSLGNWLWEFNDEGGYLSDVAGMREKGTYTLKDTVLTLNHLPARKLPAQLYTVTKLDTAQLDLISTGPGSASRLHFVKRSAGDVESGDKD